jgi:hypothetical protein
MSDTETFYRLLDIHAMGPVLDPHIGEPSHPLAYEMLHNLLQAGVLEKVEGSTAIKQSTPSIGKYGLVPAYYTIDHTEPDAWIIPVTYDRCVHCGSDFPYPIGRTHDEARCEDNMAGEQR